jgi:hypothetical protein
VLLAGQGQAAALRKLHPQELAGAAAAAAAMQLAAVQQQRAQEQGEQQLQQQPRTQQLQIEADATKRQAATAAPAQQLAIYDAVETSSSSGSSSDAGALALLSPLEQLWTQLAAVAVPQLQGSFSFDMLALLALSFARAGKADNELLISVVNAALGKANKFSESPAAVVQLLQALAVASSKGIRSSSGQHQQQLLGALGAALAQGKAQYTPQQLTEAAAAFAQLGFYSEAACLAICKMGSRSLKHWPASCIATLLGALAKLRFRDEMLLRSAVKVLPAKVAAGGLSGQQLADVLAALLHLSYNAPDLEQLITAVMR